MDAELLVIGAGPYGLSAAAAARARGLRTVVVGRPMGFWREHMPAGMLLRSGPGWHLDPAGALTLERYLEWRGIALADVDPLPLDLFLGYAEWFQARAQIEPLDRTVTALRRIDGGFSATLADGGGAITAAKVVAAPGIAHFAQLPEWADRLGEHTCDLIDLAQLSGARVLIVGGRQSAYEWAALAGEHGAERVDVVHRHAKPRFDRVSWAFTDPHVDSTLATRNWWRTLEQAEREAIGRRFWEAGRLTLEHWLAPRLARGPIRVRDNTHVVAATPREHTVAVRLADGTKLDADRVVFATGYKADLARVPYLAPLIGDIQQRDGFPVLDHAMGTSLTGLYLPGFTATNDFGPFFGFVKGAPAAATLIARDLP